MKTAQLSTFIIDILRAHKALDIREIDVTALTDITERMIISSATSKRHARTLADKVITETKKAQIQALGIEGAEESEWILIDLDHLILHIMLPEIRDFYHLEKLWQPLSPLCSQREN